MARRKNVAAASVTDTAGEPLPPSLDYETVAQFFGVSLADLLAKIAALQEKAPHLTPLSQPFMELLTSAFSRTKLDQAIQAAAADLYELARSGKGPTGYSGTTTLV